MLGAVPSPAARPPERAARVPRPACPGRGRCGQWTLHRPHSVCPRGPALLAVGVAGGRPRGGCLPPLRGAPGVRRRPFPGRSSSGACSQGSATRVSRVRSMRACGPSTGPTACALAGRRCSLWGWREGVPGGVPSTVVRGAWCQALSLPRPRSPSVACSQGSATRVSRARSMRACGPSTGPTACALAGRRCSPWGWWKGVPGGGAFHRCEGRLVSGVVPPPAARPPERAARVPRPACPGCGRCGRVDPAPASQLAPLRAGVARCGGGRRASPGGVPSTVVRGAWCQALSLPRPLVLRSAQPGFRDPCVPGAVDAGVWTQHQPHSVRPCGPALLAVGVAEGRPRGGCLPPL